MCDPLYELQILREATRLLMKTEQLSNEDEKLIATQVRNVLTTGQRQPVAEDEQPSAFDLEDEILQADSWTRPTAREDHDAFPPLSLTDTPPVSGVTAHARLWELGSTAPPCDGFTVEERIGQLGYPLLQTQRASLIPRLELRVRLEWGSRFHGTPAQYQRQDWYGEEDAQWIDPLIQAYLGQFPNITRTQAIEE